MRRARLILVENTKQYPWYIEGSAFVEHGIARALLEPEIARLAALPAAPKNISTVERVVLAQERELHSGNSAES